MKHKTLSLVVPIPSYSDNYQYLLKWIENCRNPEIEVLICYDIHSGVSSNFLEELDNVKNEYVRTISGRFLSPGGARNAGVNEATGSYIWFVDSDDELLEFDWKEIISLLQITPSNTLIIFSFSIMAGKLARNRINRIDEAFSISFARFISTPGIWRIVFPRDIISGLEFSNLKMGEDLIFILQVLHEKVDILFRQELVYGYHIGNIQQLTSTHVQLSDYVQLAAQLNLLAYPKQAPPRLFYQAILIRIFLQALKSIVVESVIARRLARFAIVKLLKHPITTIGALICILSSSIYLRRLFKK